jgi:hypothetical protein
MLSGTGSFVAVIALLMAESSNFPMHFRIICRKLGLKHTLLYESMDWMYMVIYVVFRGLISPVICTLTVLTPNFSIILKGGFFIVQVQSLYFISIMFSICKKKIREFHARKKAGVKLWWLSINPELSKLDYLKKKEKTTIF